jgi:hypothetical protein
MNDSNLTHPIHLGNKKLKSIYIIFILMICSLPLIGQTDRMETVNHENQSVILEEQIIKNLYRGSNPLEIKGICFESR